MIKGSITNNKSVDGHSNPSDVIKILDIKLWAVLDNCESQTNPVPSDSALNTSTITFSVKATVKR